ncbi:MAG: cytochrome P450 [Chloroflexota bacterium]
MAINSLIKPVNLASAAFKANPFPFYAQLRDEAPVYRTTINKKPLWLITRYQDVASALKDERFVKNHDHTLPPDQAPKPDWLPNFFHIMDNHMLDMDVPDHTRLRGFVHKAFTPSRVEQMRLRVQQLADELLDTAAQAKHFDLIEGYALPIPVTIISEVLGVPVQDRAKFHQWTKGLMSSLDQPMQLLVKIPTFIGFLNYIRKLCQMRQNDPQDDLISLMAQTNEHGERMTNDELQGMVVLLLIAGHETTVNLIASGTLALLENPDQFDLLHQNPTLIKSATEELLRYYPPIETATERYAREDVTIEGVTIPRGEQVMAVIASANRDAAQFENPDTLDLTRENNKHLSFGQGIHYCVGAPLARLEGHIALNTLVARMPTLRLDVPAEALRWRSGLTFRGLETLPVTF